MNLFDVDFPDPRNHFLVPILLAYLQADGANKGKDGFVGVGAIIEEMQSLGFTADAIESALRRANNKRLIETAERVTFEEDETGLIGDVPSSFRITAVGIYHVHRWMGVFAYLDAMVFDTPIFDSNVTETLLENIESLEIHDRYVRATTFRDYLLRQWSNAGQDVRYFDFAQYMEQGKMSFDKVRKAVKHS